MKPLAILTGLALALLMATQLLADTRDIRGTTVTLQDTNQPGAIAEVEFRNENVNGPVDNSSFDLFHNGLSVTITFTWNANGRMDRITVAAPPGYVADPVDLDVPEGSTGRVYIRVFEFQGV